MKRLKLLLLGERGVGRTTLIESYVMGTSMVNSTSSRPRSLLQCGTASYNINVVVDSSPYSLKLFDPESDIDTEELTQVLQTEMPDAVLIVYDISQVETYEGVEGMFRMVRHVMPTVKCVLVSNKSDLRLVNPQGLPLVSVEEGNMLSEKLKMRYFIETSGVNLTNVGDLIDETVRIASPAISEINFRFNSRKNRSGCTLM